MIKSKINQFYKRKKLKRARSQKERRSGAQQHLILSRKVLIYQKRLKLKKKSTKS